jgi:uncharacterized protein (DUF1499 family)
MRILWLTLAGVAGTALLLWLAGLAGAWRGTAPTDLGVVNGRLKPPSLTRNSVSSQALLHPGHPQAQYAQIDPWPLAVPGDASASLAHLARVLEGQPGVVLVQVRPDYLRAEAQTRWLRFVDDLEFWAPMGATAIEVRSASRLGREDLGTNRQRLQRLLTAYLQPPA